MFGLSQQLPASLFLALTVCCNGKATFKQNIPLWVLDDSGMGEVMNEWVFFLVPADEHVQPLPLEFREGFRSICRSALSPCHG